MNDFLFKITGSVFGIVWFFSAFTITYKLMRKYPKKFKSKSLSSFLFSFHDGNLFWKEIINPSDRKDSVLMMLINIFRFTTFLFIIIGLIWVEI